MSKPAHPGNRDARLPGINFPRMDVHTARPPQALLLAEASAQEPQGKKAQVATAPHREAPPQKTEGQGRKLGAAARRSRV